LTVPDVACFIGVVAEMDRNGTSGSAERQQTIHHPPRIAVASALEHWRQEIGNRAGSEP
jgi:hypothetical protein